MLINLVGGILHSVCGYQIIKLYTLNILQFCQLYLNKAEKKRKKTKQTRALVEASDEEIRHLT